MKKLLSLILVLGMVSMAGAGLSLQKADNVATIHSDSAQAWAALVTVTLGWVKLLHLPSKGI